MATPIEIPSAATLRRRFDEVPPLTIGIEEEVMLLDPESLDLAPVAPEVLVRLGGDVRFKPELPAAQLEIVTTPQPHVDDAIAELAVGRHDLAAAAAGVALPAAAGVHPFAAPEGVLNAGQRYEALHAEYGLIAARQLVAGLQVHVAVGGADRSLAVHNGLRCYLPELAALAANGAWYAGRDTGLASIRPVIAAQLPRQGLPPALESWDHFAAELAWGGAAGAVSDPARWWWELRPHASFGTLEVRVPDAQTTLAEATGIVALIQALVATLAERFDAGEPLPAAPTWRIAENRFSALRHGIDGAMADLVTGARRPTRERLQELLHEVRPAARRLGSERHLDHARALATANGAVRQREQGAKGGPVGVCRWLTEQFLAGG